MLKKDITFENPFTNEKVTETHYFHLNKAALVELAANGFQDRLKVAQETEEQKLIQGVIEELLQFGYVRREGDTPVRSPEIWAEFKNSEAFGSLFYELLTDEGAQGTFIASLLPSDVAAQFAEAEAHPGDPAAQMQPSHLAAVTEPKPEVIPPVQRSINLEEASQMESVELKRAIDAGEIVIQP